MSANFILYNNKLENRLELRINGLQPMFTDFTVKHWQKRRNSGKQQLIVQAVKPKTGMKIIDATAGWGCDAAILASFGAQVIMLERDAMMADLIQDGLARQTEHDKKHLKLTFIEQDSIEYLSNIKKIDYPDLIYMDPMHPIRNSTAKVKKNMQVLQNLIGPDLDAGNLLAVARKIAPVIVKWPCNQAPIAPDICCSWTGRSVRMDKFVLSL